MTRFNLGIICGGPSAERGISLNSARSVCDHTESPDVNLSIIYFDTELNAHVIPRNEVYSNTPSDFDFKLQKIGRQLDQRSLQEFLASQHLIFPAIHGQFGEDGQLQKLLEQTGGCFVGSNSTGCQRAFDKAQAKQILHDAGLPTLPWIELNREESYANKQKLAELFSGSESSGFVIKPCRSGSSFGVFVVHSPAEAQNALEVIFAHPYQNSALIEPLCLGAEFTVVVMQNKAGEPVALLPIEVEKLGDHKVFDYRLKYLASHQVAYHCPPRFNSAVINAIRVQGEDIFAHLGLRDFARFDGWFINSGAGAPRISWSDFNPISGLEQNSFFFIQAAKLGLTHQEALHYIISNAASRTQQSFPTNGIAHEGACPVQKQKVAVIFGGDTAERQVSVTSGTNVWLKLLRSSRYEPIPFLLDTDGSYWKLPYSFCLYHTVEEISAACHAANNGALSSPAELRDIRIRLGLAGDLIKDEIPKKTTLEQIAKEFDFAFLGLHGGAGEDGTIQRRCELLGLPYNGSGPQASRLCMDKFALGQVVQELNLPGLSIAEKHLVPLRAAFRDDPDQLWRLLCKELQGPPILVKPRDDGCSAGVAVLYEKEDLIKYIQMYREKRSQIPPQTLSSQPNPIDLPSIPPNDLLFERFIISDRVSISGANLNWEKRTGWIELTVGILGTKTNMQIFDPSLTVANSNVLSLEEKFQGGTGVNLTPPPENYVCREFIPMVKAKVEAVAKAAGIEGYARMDIFADVTNGNVIVIEINTLPGLTASTVLFHQAVHSPGELTPLALLEQIIELGIGRPLLFNKKGVLEFGPEDIELVRHRKF